MAREELHRLVDLLPDADCSVAQRVLSSLVETEGSPEAFAAHEPNDETIAALRESQEGRGLKRFDSFSDFLDQI